MLVLKKVAQLYTTYALAFLNLGNWKIAEQNCGRNCNEH